MISEECAYCGAPATTRDHIPPRKLFPTPRSSDLFTVPACGLHNHEASDDDEYFIWVVTISAKAIGPEADKARQQRLKPPSSPRRRRMATLLANNIVPVEVTTPAGVYLGSAPGYNVDLGRVNIVLERILRGLYFRELHRRVPATCTVSAFAEPAYDELHEETMRALLRRGPRQSSGGAFQYWFSTVDDSPDSALCLMRFFGGILALGFVMGAGPKLNVGTT